MSSAVQALVTETPSTSSGVAGAAADGHRVLRTNREAAERLFLSRRRRADWSPADFLRHFLRQIALQDHRIRRRNGRRKAPSPEAEEAA
jgi:hypothetical protein